MAGVEWTYVGAICEAADVLDRLQSSVPGPSEESRGKCPGDHR